MMKAILGMAAMFLLAAPARAGEPCLRANDMWSWSPLSTSALMIETRSHAKYRLTIKGACPAVMQNKLRIELRSQSNSDLACLALHDDVYVHSDIGPQHCTITKIEPVATTAAPQ
jgi:hypothetical protein